MRSFYTLTLGLILGACTVDGSVIDDLPCECADGFMCDATNRCIPGGEGLDAGDSGRDAGSVRDPDLGDCIAGPADLFTSMDEERWISTRDSVGVQTIEGGGFVTRVPPGNQSAYSFLSGIERVNLTNCTILVEMLAAQSGDEGVSFFSARISNDMGSIGFGVLRDEIVADYNDGSETTAIWSAEYDPLVYRWFAFRGDDGDLVWVVSADGRDWTEVGRIPAPIALDALQPLFGVGSISDNASDIEARFDNYNNPL